MSRSGPGPGVRCGFSLRVWGSGLRNVQQFRGGLVFKAHGLLYHSTLGLRLIKKKRRVEGAGYSACGAATESVAYFLRSREKYGGSLCKILVVLSVEGKILVVLSVVLSMVVLSVEGRQPRGGVPPSPQESTCLNIINFRAACGINFVTPPPKFRVPEALVLHRVDATLHFQPAATCHY